MLGLPAERILHCEDPDEQVIWDTVRREAAILMEERMISLARHIVNEYAKAQERGAKKSGKGG